MIRSGPRFARLIGQLRSVVFTKKYRANVPSALWRRRFDGDPTLNWWHSTGDYIFMEFSHGCQQIALGDRSRFIGRCTLILMCIIERLFELHYATDIGK